MSGFFSKKRIFKDNQACLTDLKHKSDLSLNKIPSNSINVFKELDIIKKNPLEQTNKILEIYKETFQNLSKTIDDLNKELDEHILYQGKKSSSFKKNQEKYKQELELNTCEYVLKKLNSKITVFKNDLVKTQTDMNIFILFSEQLELFINELRNIEKEYNCEFNKLQNDFNPILINIKKIYDIKNELNDLVEGYILDTQSLTFSMLKKQVTNFNYFFNNLIKMLESLESFFKKLYVGLEHISNKHLSEFLEQVTIKILNVQGTKYLNYKIEGVEKNIDLGSIYKEMTDKVYLDIDIKYKNLLLTFSNNQQSHVVLNNNTKKTFQDLYSLFNNKKEELLKRRKLHFENAKEIILKKYGKHIKNNFYSEFKRYYEAGDYQAILRSILELDTEKLKIMPRGITRAIDFQQNDDVLFHAIGTLHRYPDGSYKNSSMPPRDYAQLLLKIMREGLKASNRSQYSLKDDYEGDLIKELDFCKEIYFWKVKKNETLSSHYFSFPAATAGILFDPHNYCAVHEIRKGGSTTVAGMEEHIILVNPKVNISSNNFTLLLHHRKNVTFSVIDSIKNTGKNYTGYEYFEELKKHLDSMMIPYIVI